MKKLVMVICTLCLAGMLFSQALAFDKAPLQKASSISVVKADIASTYSMQKLKRVINSPYFNDHPEIQDAIVYSLLFDFEGVPDDFSQRALGYALYFGELWLATPVDHRYYKLFGENYRYWAEEAERIAEVLGQ